MVRMVQIIWLVEQDYRAVKNVKSSKFTICNSQQTEKVWQVEFNTIAWVFGLNTAESEMFNEMRPNYSS